MRSLRSVLQNAEFVLALSEPLTFAVGQFQLYQWSVMFGFELEPVVGSICAVVGHAAFDSETLLPKSVCATFGRPAAVHLRRAVGSVNVLSSPAFRFTVVETPLTVSVWPPGLTR